eukprot:2670955-Rhodomonas_salina.4
MVAPGARIERRRSDWYQMCCRCICCYALATQSAVLGEGVVLRACYGLCGTELALATPCGTQDKGYAATRVLRTARY